MADPRTPVEHEYTPETVCPYCGYEDGDSWELQSNEGTQSCSDCGKEYHYERNIEVTYRTRRIISD